MSTGGAQQPQPDHWSSEVYQNAAGFVPQLASKVVQWLDVQSDDVILDIGCGDGVLTQEIADKLTSGSIHGIDSSASMIQTALKDHASTNCTYAVVDATKLLEEDALRQGSFDKIFSNAALHWILRDARSRLDVFQAAQGALKAGGKLCFEMGGRGNVAEIRAALLSTVAHRIGIARAREADPWFFPDEDWMRGCVEACGFAVEKMELEYRPTKCETGKGGGIRGWVELMGKQFFDAVAAEGTPGREECIQEVTNTLETVCASPRGGSYIGYVRLRCLARKV